MGVLVANSGDVTVLFCSSTTLGSATAKPARNDLVTMTFS